LNGANITGGTSTAPVSLISGDPINVTLAYDGSILTETMVDATTLSSYTKSFLVNLTGAVGGSTAYVGFTAANTGNETATQTLSKFDYVTPEPSSAVVSFISIGVICLRRRRRADL
jgi:hypothetical protein